MDKCKNCQSAVVMIEYRGTSEDYDGVSEYECLKCGERRGRWTGKILLDGEIEPRYGIKK